MEAREGSHASPVASAPAASAPAASAPAVAGAAAGLQDAPPPAGEPDATAVAAALASLRREHREVIVCTFYQQLSADDAAARLGISVRDVKRRASSALREIRRILEERGVQVPQPPATLPVPRPLAS
ncbi:MAG TPA: sigma factor-like helix-turn-helix DNA-binding protein [Streptosporangiaceae bacterium]